MHEERHEFELNKTHSEPSYVSSELRDPDIAETVGGNSDVVQINWLLGQG
jgi:hypothetical protein